MKAAMEIEIYKLRGVVRKNTNFMNLSIYTCITEYYRVTAVHCYNRKVCLPVIPGKGAVSFMTVWFFPHKNFAISRG